MEAKRPQGRPPNGGQEVGSTKIVEGMQSALRVMQTVNVTRKDIARFSGVTPALVTYYFPEKNTLIDAATNPIVESLADEVRTCLRSEDLPNKKLMNLIEILINCFKHDTCIIELYKLRRETIGQGETPNALDELINEVFAFFTVWQQVNTIGPYHPRLLTKILLGSCNTVGRQHGLASGIAAHPGADVDGGPSEALLVYTFFVAALTHTNGGLVIAFTGLPHGVDAIRPDIPVRMSIVSNSHEAADLA